jgi:hypothetical protein
VTDYAGRERAAGLATDIGAYEQSGLVPLISGEQTTANYPEVTLPEVKNQKIIKK